MSGLRNPYRFPTVTITYGEDGRHKVELRRNPWTHELEGRYLASPDGIGRATEWEPRERDLGDPDDIHHEVLDAVERLLDAYDHSPIRQRARSA